VTHGPKTTRLDFIGDPDHDPDLGFLSLDQDLDPGIFLEGFLVIFGIFGTTGFL